MGITCKLSKERYSFSDGVNIFASEENFPVRAKKESLCWLRTIIIYCT